MPCLYGWKHFGTGLEIFLNKSAMGFCLSVAFPRRKMFFPPDKKRLLISQFCRTELHSVPDRRTGFPACPTAGIISLREGKHKSGE